MKRVAGLCLLVLATIAVVYGLAVARVESDYEDLIERGDAALARDDSSDAIEAYSVAISLQPESMAAHLKRGEAYRRRNEFGSALRDLRRAAELDPIAPYPRESLGDAYSAMGWHGRAADHYREHLTLDDRSPRVLYKLALASLQLGQTTAAIESLGKALAIDDRVAPAHYLLGVCFRETQQRRQAIASLERAVELDPALLPAREALAQLYARPQRLDQRNRHLEALAALDPRASREAALALGYAEADVERAVLRLATAAQQFPGDPQPFVALGRVWLDRAQRGGRVELTKAIRALETAAAGDGSSEVQTLYGRALLLAGEVTRAHKVLEQATTKFPIDPLAFYHLAEAAERRGNPLLAHRALLDYERLEGPGSPRLTAGVLTRIAEGHLRSGNVDDARKTVERALGRDPMHAGAGAVLARLVTRQP